MRFLFATAVVALCAMALTVTAAEKGKKKEKAGSPVLSHKMKNLDGKEVDLASYQGKVVLMVNVASKCGKTPQYKGLQELHDKYASAGLAILGFPCNQFGGQEPGSADDIKQFCDQKYGVKFDLFSKIDVNGDDAAPLYKYLTSKDLPVKDQGPIKWNFEKFLIDRSGNVVARYRSGDKPEDFEKDVVAALKQK